LIADGLGLPRTRSSDFANLDTGTPAGVLSEETDYETAEEEKSQAVDLQYQARAVEYWRGGGVKGRPRGACKVCRPNSKKLRARQKVSVKESMSSSAVLVTSSLKVVASLHWEKFVQSATRIMTFNR